MEENKADEDCRPHLNSHIPLHDVNAHVQAFAREGPHGCGLIDLALDAVISRKARR
jgi:hypothetical protein